MNEPVVIVFNWMHIISMCVGWTIANMLKIIFTDWYRK